MGSQIIGILIGGFIPAILFGASGFLNKVSIEKGISPSIYLICVGLSTIVTGGLFCSFESISKATRSAYLTAVGSGLCWSIAAISVSIALQNYRVPISKLVPLYNMNTLVAVLLGLCFYAEWKDANVSQLIIGSLLIVGGGVLVAKA